MEGSVWDRIGWDWDWDWDSRMCQNCRFQSGYYASDRGFDKAYQGICWVIP